MLLVGMTGTRIRGLWALLDARTGTRILVLGSRNTLTMRKASSFPEMPRGTEQPVLLAMANVLLGENLAGRIS